jgi:serine protease Do
VILQFDGKDIPDTRTLLRTVADTAAGKSVPMVVWRDGARKTLSVKVGEMEADQTAASDEAKPEEGKKTASPGSIEALGLTLATIDDAAREKMTLPENASGVVVTNVDRASEAARKDIRRGDMIARIGDKDVKNVADVKAAVAAEKKSGRSTILLRVRRGDNYLFIALKAEEAKKAD